MHHGANLGGSAQQITEALRQELNRLETARRPTENAPVGVGCAAFDRLLPGGGFARGSLVEWLAAGPADGAGTLALLAARAALTPGSAVVVFDRVSAPPAGRFHPPGAAALGLDLASLIVVRAASDHDELWALYQTLRSPGVAAVWAPLANLEWRWFRRLQLAAESGGAVGHLLRPASVRGRPTWSQLQLLVEPQRSAAGGRRLRVELVRCKARAGAPGGAGGAVELELDDATGTLREASLPHETHPFTLAAPLAPPGKKRGARGKRLAS